MEPKAQKVAVVTGSSTGIGFETCLLFARNGFLTYATMRDLTKTDLIENIAEKENLPLKVIQMDVNKHGSVVRAFKEISEDHERGMGIDILVNNAGFGLFGALEDQSIEHIKKQFETNLFGAIRTIQQVLPIMRNQRSGIIVNISSISGQIGFPAQSVYASTKFALEGLSESLAYEVEPYGICVVLIEPGVINSNFVENIMLPDNARGVSSQVLSPPSRSKSETVPYSGSPDSNRDKMTEYANVVERFLSHYYPAMRNAPSPKEVAKVILASINDSLASTTQGSNSNFCRYLVGEDAKLYADVKRKMSDYELHSFIAKRVLS
jgi:NAD(P)-dependent dehydrogenase (short-subunit alcohol dehydrogenase family)